MASQQGNRGPDAADNGKVRLSMWLTSRQHRELKSLAEYEGRTVSDIIRQLISIHLRDMENGGDNE